MDFIGYRTYKWLFMSKDKKVQYPVRDGCLGLPLLVNVPICNHCGFFKANKEIISLRHFSDIDEFLLRFQRPIVHAEIQYC